MTLEQTRTLFATKLENLRADRGWTQTELARRASQFSEKPITRDRISKYSLGHSLPGKPHLAAISKALGVEQDDLLPPASFEIHRHIRFGRRSSRMGWRSSTST